MKANSIKPPVATADALFKDFTNSDPWRIFRIMAEFVDSFETMSQFDHVVTVFGSARTKPEEPDYQEAEKLGRILANAGHPVLTGGGPGIMEAANKGAKEAGGISIGLNIKLPMEQSSNPYLTDEVDFHYFFIRKVNFLKYTEGVAVFPGGFGTMDEFFEVVTLIQTNKMPQVPICLVCSDFWQPVIDWFSNVFIPKQKISPAAFSDLLLSHRIQ
jgi:uncharacterized protein (TIGR00730 family)